MSRHLTPDMAETAYEFLRTCKPFVGLQLPHADEVEFRITRHKAEAGACWHEGERVGIDLSLNFNGHIYSEFLATMAHEMIHLWQIRSGCAPNHNGEFRRKARVVCKYFVFEEKVF